MASDAVQALLQELARAQGVQVRAAASGVDDLKGLLVRVHNAEVAAAHYGKAVQAMVDAAPAGPLHDQLAVLALNATACVSLEKKGIKQ